jgi:Uma2 family endonuclease
MPAGPPKQATLPVPDRPWVAEDLDALPVDNVRREIIGGTLIVSPTPNLRHQWCLGELFTRLRAAAPPEMLVIQAPYDWRPPTGENFQPDLVVFRMADADPDGPLRATPLLVVEILSPSNAAYDRGWKRVEYERLQVPACWIVDAAVPSVSVLRLRGRRYEEAARATGDERLAVDFPFPVTLAPAPIAAERRAGQRVVPPS